MYIYVKKKKTYLDNGNITIDNGKKKQETTLAASELKSTIHIGDKAA